MAGPTVVIVPGLRDHVAEHWQTLLAASLPRVRVVPPQGREDLRCALRTAAIDKTIAEIAGKIVLVAHSGGVISVMHWARSAKRSIHGALLAVPPDFERPLPPGYPTLQALEHGGWLPVPRDQLPFPSLVAASRNDPLCSFERAAELAANWGSRLIDLGNVGHLNPAAGFGPWPQAWELIAELAR